MLAVLTQERTAGNIEKHVFQKEQSLHMCSYCVVNFIT